MRQKVWVIDDPSWNESPGKPRMDNPSPAKRPFNGVPTNGRPLPTPPQKSPALSFSFSMLVWGSGQLYIREYRAGWTFMSAMLFFCSGFFSLLYFRDPISRFLSRFDVPVYLLMIGSAAFLFTGLLLWLFNGVHAYYRTERLRSEYFQGVDNEIWPLLCSLLCPGWGQFLNGQPKKGLFFLLFGLVGFLSLAVLFAAQSVWPALRTSSDRFVFDLCLAAALSAAPTTLLMWLVAVYDSFRSCREPLRKMSLFKRWQYAGKRMRTHGVRHILPSVRTTAVLGLLLTASVLAGLNYFPKGYYLSSLERVRVEMLNRHLEITPELIAMVIHHMDR